MSERTSGDAASGADDDVVVSERRALTNLAYRLLGSLTEAEDAVQEGYARWFSLGSTKQQEIVSPGAWLSTVVSRICFDQLGSARARRERYVGEWIPEPVPTRAEWNERSLATVAGDPADHITLDETVEMAFLVVLDSMTPAERVAFLLHDVFGFPFNDIATIVGRTPGACRQLASSARNRLASARRADAPRQQRAGIVREFRLAWQAKDLDALIRLLDPSVVATADGGGVATASPVPIEGQDQVAAFLVFLASMAGRLDLRERSVNGQPGLVAVDGDTVLAVYAFELNRERIHRIWAIRNPDKLRPWTSR